MIPKKIHYCWYGGNELPELAKFCIESWKKYCPDYEIIRWDESNTDLQENDYIREAFEAKKWAFITDYVRLNVLYKYGGIYMDTDVELLRNLDDYLNYEAFSGFENSTQIPTGIMSAEKGHPFFRELLSYYDNRHFLLADGSFDVTTNVLTITEIALKNGFVPNNTIQQVCGMFFFPRDYFCPKDHSTGKVNLTENSVCIHHFDGSWHSETEKKLIKKEQHFVARYGKNVGELFFKIYKYMTHPKLLFNRITKRHTK